MTVPVFINPTDMRVSASGSDRERPIGVMGQWYLERRPENAGGLRRFTASDAAETEFFTEELKTQPAFPPVMIEYQAGWYTPGDDDGPMASPPENTLLSSRLLIANGIHGFNYFPLQDTYRLRDIRCRGRIVHIAGMRRLRRMANSSRGCTRCFAIWKFCSVGGRSLRRRTNARTSESFIRWALSTGAAGARGYFAGVGSGDANRAAGGYGAVFERAC